ncbi:MAG: hypothetical protein MMC23_007480 [Stictis urceolatum]|nr:hypothetical protein [Stictis urceolata]
MIAMVLKWIAKAVVLSVVTYLAFLGLLTVPAIQSQVIYLNRVTLTWFQDVNVPEQWGFLPNQVTPFHLRTPDGETLHAWHILPISTYLDNQEALLSETPGLAPDITTRQSFKLLHDDPDSLLVLYLHGAAGTLGSGYRPPSYRALYAAAPSRIHTVAIDYRGFGSSTGSPSEEGLLTDALTLLTWATEVAHIPPSRIVLFSQSIGTAVAVSLVHHLALLPDPAYLRGMVLVAPFSDVEALTKTYRIAGTVPLLSPVAKVPGALRIFNRLIWTKWDSKRKLTEFVRRCEEDEGGERRFFVNLVHAKDDYDIPWGHTEELFWAAINASLPEGIGFGDLERENEGLKRDFGAGGWVVERKTRKGLLREEILEYGLHDRIMSYPVVSRAIWRAFQSGMER